MTLWDSRRTGKSSVGRSRPPINRIFRFSDRIEAGRPDNWRSRRVLPIDETSPPPHVHPHCHRDGNLTEQTTGTGRYACETSRRRASNRQYQQATVPCRWPSRRQDFAFRCQTSVSGSFQGDTVNMVDCGSSDTTNRFVCPNDRQLALRAKLKTGWSVKTASLSCHGSSVNQPLGPEEQAAIVDVIKRAEEVDLTEQERVGRLVERLENMRRNALGRNPSQCLLCGDGFGMLGAQKVLCIDCRRLVCQKCAIESCPAKTTRNYWLCLICAETREIWKKSGAWFFKSIPKYILPSEKPANYRQGGSKILRNAKGAHREDDSSSDEERKVWSKIHRRNSSTESTHDVHESVQDAPAMSTYNRQTSSSEAQLGKDVEPLKGYMGSMSLAEAKTWEKDQASGDSSELSRRESTVSRSLSEWNWSDTRSEEKISPSTSSVSSSVFKSTIDEHKPSDTSMGTIELSLTYNPVTATLICTVYRAKNLIPMDINGLSDPFCKLNILPDGKKATRLKTKTVHKTRNPEFNENLNFYDISEADLAKKSLHILVFDDDKRPSTWPHPWRNSDTNRRGRCRRPR
uniref:Rabphilin n=1 Tax=Tenebrio molitor TaxID=7067 RepID=A0A8J6L0T2_TENMO|nr:hypothetical protein GEV33_015107 [Tenebrio molitor]